MFGGVFSTEPQTHSVISQKNRVFVAGYGGALTGKMTQIGALSRFNVAQSRDTEIVRGVGQGDIIVELVPNYQGGITIAYERALFYLSNMFQAFGYAGGIDGLVRSLRHHRYPFDIKQEIVFSDVATAAALTTFAAKLGNTEISSDNPALRSLINFYVGCWITDYNAEYGTDSSRVLENGSIMAADCTEGPGYSFWAQLQASLGGMVSNIVKGVVSSSVYSSFSL